MCGIAGKVAADPRRVPLDPAALEAMTAAIAHRGPDDRGALLEPGAALGMRRLAVIDVAGSRQPIASEDGEVQAVFNGEIYNFAELRRELRGRGHRLATDGDGEVIVHLYEELGPRFAERLRGMFAIAVWDRRRRRLVLARDPLGVKPLYFAELPDGLAFASEVKALIAGGLVEPALDPVGAELFMAWGFVPGPATLFAGVRKLLPATTLTYDGGRLAEDEYWRPREAPRSGRAGLAADRERLLELLRGSTHGQMVSDVPLGVMLSGGLDSSLIAALAAETGTGPVKTFSIGFVEDAEANELGAARSVARRLGTEHHELETSALDHPELLRRTLTAVEEPIADLSGVGFMLLSELARETVTVALSGQGADELLGGYRKHQIAWAGGVAARLPGARRALAAAARLGPPGSTFSRGMTALGSSDPVTRMLAMSRVVQAGERAATFAPAFLDGGGEEAVAATIRRPLAGGPPRTPLAETLYLDTKLGLVDNMLLYFDKASMAASLEVRVPFLDQDLVSFCCSLPDSRRVRLGNRKALLKAAARGLIDDAIIDRPKRGFFHSALGTWLEVQREDLLAETLRDERTRGRGLFREAEVERLLARAGGEGKKASQRLFCLFLLELWLRQWVDADAPGRQRPERAPALAA